MSLFVSCVSLFFFNDTATTEIYTLSLHDALPIFPPNWWHNPRRPNNSFSGFLPIRALRTSLPPPGNGTGPISERKRNPGLPRRREEAKEGQKPETFPGESLLILSTDIHLTEFGEENENQG